MCVSWAVTHWVIWGENKPGVSRGCVAFFYNDILNHNSSATLHRNTITNNIANYNIDPEQPQAPRSNLEQPRATSCNTGGLISLLYTTNYPVQQILDWFSHQQREIQAPNNPKIKREEVLVFSSLFYLRFIVKKKHSIGVFLLKKRGRSYWQRAKRTNGPTAEPTDIKDRAKSGCFSLLPSYFL